MDAAAKLKTFQQIQQKARRAGLLRYDAHGVLILVQPDVVQVPAPLAGQPGAGQNLASPALAAPR